MAIHAREGERERFVSWGRAAVLAFFSLLPSLARAGLKTRDEPGSKKGEKKKKKWKNRREICR